MPLIDVTKTIEYFNYLTDERGIIQFSLGREKDLRFGYAIEDQARALLIATRLNDQKLIKVFLTILLSCVKIDGVDMLWDSEGRSLGKTDYFNEAGAEVLWALGDFGRSNKKNLSAQLLSIVNHLVLGLQKNPFPRAKAYALLGIAALGDVQKSTLFADSLVNGYRQNSDSGWHWFENQLTYANALLPWALFEAYKLTTKLAYLEVATHSLNFLFEHCQKDDVPIVVGNQGWWQRGKPMPPYGQQPIDISYLCMACLAAYRVTSEKRFLEKAFWYYSWFSGNNLQRVSMIRDDGGCFDGLYLPDEARLQGLNPNAGAESTICFLLAHLELQKY